MPLPSVFDRAFKLQLQREGRDTDDPNDAGGLTRWGIAQNMHPELDVANMTYDDAVEFFRKEYWVRPGYDRVALISERLAIKLYDIGVSQGWHRGSRWLQLALRKAGHDMLVDGIVGKHTLEALEFEVNEGRTARLMDELRMSSLGQRIDRVIDDPTDLTYFRGWVIRALDLDGRFS